MIQSKEREKLGILLALIFELLDETSFPDQKKRQEALNKLIIYNAESGYNFDPNDSEFLPKLLIKILEGSSRPVELPPGNLPPSELIEIYEKEKQEKEDQIQKAIGSKEAYKNYRSYIDILKKRVLVEQPKLPEQLALAIAEKSAQKAIATFEPLAHPNVATEEDKSQILKQVETIIENELKKVEIEAKVIQKAEAIVSQEAERIKNESIKIAIQPTIIEAIKTRVLPPKKEAFTSKELPPEIIKQIESTFKQETYSPAKTILSPQASFALAKRTLYTPFVKAIQMEVNSWQVPPAQKEAFERFKKMVFDGVFKEDYEATYRFLQSYLPKNHPAFTYLENEMSASDEIQKVNGKDYPFVRVLKQYYNYTKKTEKWQSFDKNLSIHLKSSPEPLWAKRGYNLLIKRFVDKFQFIPRSYQKVFTFISRG